MEKVFAREYRFYVSDPLVNNRYVQIKGIETVGIAPLAEETDITDFDSEGMEEVEISQRGAEITLEGNELLVPIVSLNQEGQAIINSLSDEMGNSGIAKLRIIHPSGTVKEHNVVILPLDIDLEDRASWGVVLKRTGSPVEITDDNAIYEGGNYMTIYYNEQTGKSEVVKGKDGAFNTRETESPIIKPIEVQSRYVHDIQTHAGVSILPNQWNNSAWIDSHVNGTPLTYLALTASMASGTGMVVSVDFSHDGTTFFSGTQNPLFDGTKPHFGTIDDLKLPARYFRIAIQNKDATNPKTTTAYARLKA